MPDRSKSPSDEPPLSSLSKPLRMAPTAGVVQPTPLHLEHIDYLVLKRVTDNILQSAGGADRLAVTVCSLIRQAIDEVIDAPRTNRFVLSEIEKTEKTYLGTKIEILLRNFLCIPKGNILDFNVGGVEVDVKHSTGKSWAIPLEALGHPCILITENESTALCSMGVVVARREYLGGGTNRDHKRGVSAQTLRQHVWWLFKDRPYTPNFWETVPSSDREAIMTVGGGTQRIAALFRAFQLKPISRVIVQAVAQQDDYMKRIRRNGGARDILAADGIAVLWGQKHRELISQLGLPPIGPEEFISYKPTNSNHVALLRNAGEID